MAAFALAASAQVVYAQVVYVPVVSARVVYVPAASVLVVFVPAVFAPAVFARAVSANIPIVAILSLHVVFAVAFGANLHQYPLYCMHNHLYIVPKNHIPSPTARTPVPRPASVLKKTHH